MPLALAAALAMTLAGCGAGQDLAAKTPTAILAAARTAARDASAVHVLSEISEDGAGAKAKTNARRASTLELQLTSGGGRARLALLGGESEAIRVDGTLYVKGISVLDGAPERRTGAHVPRTGVHVPEGSWLKTPANGSQLREYAALTEPAGELMLLLRDPTISLTKGAITTIKGQRAIELKTKGRLYSGAIYVATSGEPYPIEIVQHGHENGRTTFRGWNDPVTLRPPGHAIALGELEHNSHR